MCDSLIEKAAPKYTMKFFFAQQSEFKTLGGVRSRFRTLKFPLYCVIFSAVAIKTKAK